MAYSTGTLNKVSEGIAIGPAIWTYTNGADTDADINAAGYVTDADDKGLAVGDFVLFDDTATPKGSAHYVASIAAGAATLAFVAVA